MRTKNSFKNVKTGLKRAIPEAHTIVSPHTYDSISRYVRKRWPLPTYVFAFSFEGERGFLRKKLAFSPKESIFLSGQNNNSLHFANLFPFRALFPSKQALANYSKPTINVIQTGVLMTYEIFMYICVDTTI